MKPALFTRENPCTKVHIFNAFWRNGNFRDIPVVEVRAYIGVNTPKYLKREGYIVELVEGHVEIYRLTVPGKYWLETGLRRHLELHPSDIAKCRETPPGFKRPVQVPALLLPKPKFIPRQRPGTK